MSVVAHEIAAKTHWRQIARLRFDATRLSCVHDAHKAARVAALSSTEDTLWRIRSTVPKVGPSIPNSDISIRGIWRSLYWVARRVARICGATNGNIGPTEPSMMIRSGLSNLTMCDKPRTIHLLQSCGGSNRRGAEATVRRLRQALIGNWGQCSLPL